MLITSINNNKLIKNRFI